MGETSSKFQSNRPKGLAAGIVGFVCHILDLKKKRDGAIGLGSFNNHYDSSLKKARKSLLSDHGVLIVEGDLNEVEEKQVSSY